MPDDVPNDRCLLDRFPTHPNQQIDIDCYWSADDCDLVVAAMAQLGMDLRANSKRIQQYRNAGDIRMLRGEVALALLRVQEILTPICGADTLRSLIDARDVFAEAYHERRHWLVTFKRDEPHVPHKAVYRVVLKASAAAILDYFKSFQDELGMKQEDIENRIAEAMETGGFRVRLRRDQRLSGRTVRDWLDQFDPSRKRDRKRPPAYAVRTFEGVKKALADSRREKLALDFLYEELADLTSQCRAQAELFARDRASTVRKT